MKIDNVGMIVGFVASVVVFEIREAPLWLEAIGTVVGTFVGWQAGCIAEIIWANGSGYIAKDTTDPDPERSDADITMAAFRKYSNLTADERAFIAEHDAKQNRQRRKPYIEDTYMDDDIKNV